MSMGFNWIKNPRIKTEIIDYLINEIEQYKLIGNNKNSTSYSAGNIIKVDRLFEKYCNAQIASLNDDDLNTNNIDDLELINPKDIVKYINIILSNKNDKDVMEFKDRLEFMKELSKEVYYLYYDIE